MMIDNVGLDISKFIRIRAEYEKLLKQYDTLALNNSKQVSRDEL